VSSGGCRNFFHELPYILSINKLCRVKIKKPSGLLDLGPGGDVAVEEGVAFSIDRNACC